MDVSKRALFSGKARYQPIRPPWAIAEERFVDACNGCNDCVTACPQHILRMVVGDLPEVDFHSGECTFCGDCVAACKSGAISREHYHDWRQGKSSSPWPVTVSFKEQDCLAHNGIACQICYENCEYSAISMRYADLPIPVPDLNRQSCVGCGACIHSCPRDAFFLEHVPVQNANPGTTEPGEQTSTQGMEPIRGQDDYTSGAPDAKPRTSYF